MKTTIPRLLSYCGLILSLAIFFPGTVTGENTIPADTALNVPAKAGNSLKRKSFKMTTLTFGGNGINLTKVNNKFTVMTGGRGAATFNDRYTIGGGGWGMTRGVEAESTAEGIYNFVKMGYGGIDFGYLVCPGEKFNLGTRLLIGGGAVFNETVPESKNNSFKMFPVMEPAVYYQVSLGKLFRFEMGASYRLIRGTDLPFISDKELSGFSCYVGLLVRAGEPK